MNLILSTQADQNLKPAGVSDSEGDLSSGETRAWVDRRGKKSKEVIVSDLCFHSKPC